MCRTPRSLLLFAALLAACGDDSPSATDGALPDAAPPDAGPPALAVGEVVELPVSGGGWLELEVATPAGSERYVLVLHATDWAGAGEATYAVTVDARAVVVGPAPAPPGRRPPPLRPAATPPAPAASSPAHLRDLPVLAEALADGRARPATPRLRAAPTVGEERTFRVGGTEIVARAELVADRIAVWLDTTSDPPASISPEDLAAIADGYDDVVLPREHVFFGQESDVDADGMVSVLLSPLVNAGGTIAYFYPCDLLAPGAPGCPYSNEAELLYLTPPNVLEFPMNTPNALLETLAHETNHMIFFAEKYVSQARTSTDVDNMYLLEGLAALAQDLTGFQAGNLYVAWAGLEGIADVATYRILADHLGYDSRIDGTLRGAAYLFARYVYDQAGGDVALPDGTFEDGGGIAYLRALCGGPELGLEAVRAGLDRDLGDAVFDFFTALAVTNRGAEHGPISSDPRFNYRPRQLDPVTDRQRGFDAWAPLHGGNAMTGPATLPLAEADGAILLSGAEYLDLAASSAGGRLLVQITGGSGATLRARLARVE